MRNIPIIPLLLLLACSSQEDSWTHAEIGPARVGQAGETFNFDNPAMADQYSWSFSARPPDSVLTDADLLGADEAWVSFVPDCEGLFVLNAQACTEGAGCSTARAEAYVGAVGEAILLTQRPSLPSTLMGSPGIRDPDNQAPVAVGAVARSLRAGGGVRLSGGKSYDPDGDVLRFRWSFYAIPASSSLSMTDIEGFNAVDASFEPDVVGDWTVQLRVSDGKAVDTVQLPTLHVSMVDDDDPMPD